MTQMGVILGTAAYMAPEQAKGKPVDKRADIWAYGCVLFEMLTGRRAFEGEDVTETLAAVVRGEPDWSRLPPQTPLAVRRVLKRCLERDPRGRIRDIADAAYDLGSDSSELAAPAAKRRGRYDLLAVVGVAVAAAAAIAAFMATRPAPAHVQVVRASLEVPSVLRLTIQRAQIAISPDGRYLAVLAGETLTGLST